MSLQALRDRPWAPVNSPYGCIGDLEVNTCTGEITALIIPGNGLLASISAKNRTVIPWRDIERIGKDTILVRYETNAK